METRVRREETHTPSGLQEPVGLPPHRIPHWCFPLEAWGSEFEMVDRSRGILDEVHDQSFAPNCDLGSMTNACLTSGLRQGLLELTKGSHFFGVHGMGIGRSI